MDDSVKTVLAVKDLGIHTFIAINDFNLDFKDAEITNIYSMNGLYNEIHTLGANKKTRKN